MSVKIKTIKKGLIDISSYSTKRKIDINIEDLKEWKKNAFKLDEPVSAPSLVRNEAGLLTNNKPKIIITSGRIEFPIDYPYPQFILNMVSNLKLLYNLKSEIKSFKVMMYPPCDSQDITNQVKTFEIPKADLQILSRVIIVAGHREVFNLSASVNGQSGTGKIICMSGDSFSLPIGVSAGLEVNFDNSTVIVMPEKKGFRSGEKLKKMSDKRFVCVVDFTANVEVVGKYLTDKTKDLINPYADEDIDDFLENT